MPSVYLGLGSNLGDRQKALHRALCEMQRSGILALAISPLYETEPWGVVDQPRFLNAVCQATTAFEPHKLLALLKSIEVNMGRVPAARYGPRVIDLDILIYDDLRLETVTLTIPHPGMLERASVLVPLVDIAAGLRHPITGRTIAEHRAQLGVIPGVRLYPPGLGSSS